MMQNSVPENLESTLVWGGSQLAGCGICRDEVLDPDRKTVKCTTDFKAVCIHSTIVRPTCQ